MKGREGGREGKVKEDGETAHKFEETDQQIERFKVFGKSGNGSKI